MSINNSGINFEGILGNIFDGVWIINSNAETVYVNQRLANNFNYKRENMIGKSFYEFMDEDNIDLAKTYFNRRKEGIIEEHDFEFIDGLGDKVSAKLFTFPIYDDKNNFNGAISFFQDISLVKKTNRELKETKRMFSTLLCNLMGIVYRCRNDENWTMEFLSEQFYDLTGYKSAEVLFNKKISYAKIIHPDDRDYVWNEVQSAINEKRSFQIEYRIIHKNGEIIWVQEQGQPVTLDNNNILFLEGYIHDITEQEKYKNKLKNEKEKVLELYTRTEFLKDLFTHDINNILQSFTTGIQLIQKYLERSVNNELIEEILEKLLNLTKRGRDLVRNIIKISDLKKKEFALKPIKALPLLRKSIKNIKMQYPEKEIDITINIIQNKILVMANNYLEDVFDNILTNAVRYNDTPRKEILIDVSKKKVNGKKFIQLNFQDNGIGIEDDRKDKIFVRSVHEDKSIYGMGLGLSLVKTIVDKFKGKIWVEDRIKGDYTRGSNFVLLLSEVY
jgi:PAS domain S-box-containing protein